MKCGKQPKAEVFFDRAQIREKYLSHGKDWKMSDADLRDLVSRYE
jgi:hypothetical protein